MREYQDTNLALLSQKEVDALVTFLTGNSIEQNVLSQESVDRLVALLRGDVGRTHMDFFDTIVKPAKDFLQEKGIRRDVSEICVLSVETDGTGFMKLFATNKDTGEMMEITPEVFDEEDKEAGWGFSMAPISFNRLARILDLRYTTDTYDKVCKLFAEKNYGSEDAYMPAVYYPTQTHLLQTLL